MHKGDFTQRLKTLQNGGKSTPVSVTSETVSHEITTAACFHTTLAFDAAN